MIEPLTHTALDGTAHGFFTRQGGVSTGLYESLNTGLGSEDARARVLENRDRVRLHLGASALATAYQTHSTVTAFIDAPQEAIKADALVTTRRGLAIGALAADCAPVLLADTQNGIIGAAHSGWRGAFDGILASVAATMRENGGTHIAAVIGPCISKKLMRSALNSLPALRAIMPMTSIYSRRPRKAAIICLTCRLLCSGNWRASMSRRIS